jgi:hypothetical protein
VTSGAANTWYRGPWTCSPTPPELDCDPALHGRRSRSAAAAMASLPCGRCRHGRAGGRCRLERAAARIHANVLNSVHRGGPWGCAAGSGQGRSSRGLRLASAHCRCPCSA